MDPTTLNVPYVNITSDDDPRVDIFRGLKSLGPSPHRPSSIFIAEGPETIKLLLLAPSPLTVTALFLKPATFQSLLPALRTHRHLLDQYAQKSGGDAHLDNVPVRSPLFSSSSAWPFPIYVAHHKVMAQVIGMETCRGSLAAGVIPTAPVEVLQRHLSGIQPLPGSMTTTRRTDGIGGNVSDGDRDRGRDGDGDGGRIDRSPTALRLLAIDNSHDDANVGAMVRSARCLGVDAVLLSHQCADAWSRRAIRTSMGHVFQVNI